MILEVSEDVFLIDVQAIRTSMLTSVKLKFKMSMREILNKMLRGELEPVNFLVEATALEILPSSTLTHGSS